MQMSDDGAQRLLCAIAKRAVMDLGKGSKDAASFLEHIGISEVKLKELTREREAKSGRKRQAERKTA